MDDSNSTVTKAGPKNEFFEKLNGGNSQKSAVCIIILSFHGINFSIKLQLINGVMYCHIKANVKLTNNNKTEMIYNKISFKFILMLI